MNGGAWLIVAAGAGALGGLLSSLQHALREVSRHSLEQAAIRRELLRRGRISGRRGLNGKNGENGNGAGANGGSTGSVQALAGDASGVAPPAAVVAVANDLDGHTATVAVPRVLCNLLFGVSAVLWVAHVRGPGAPQVIDVAIGLGCAGVLTWLLSVVVPLAVARHAAERTVLAWLWLVRTCHAVVGPMRLVLAFVAEVVRRLAGEEARDELEAREAELLSLVEESEREGQIDEHARDMIEAVVEFSSTTVEQVMTPRTEIQALEYTDDLDAVRRYAQDSGHSRIPVFREDIDHIEGVLYLKDLLRWMLAKNGQVAGEPFVLSDLLREPTFVPETKPVREFLKERLEDKIHIAIALDEYGGTSGLVTLEDIVEEVFGEIRDEYEPEEPETPAVVIDPDTGEAHIEARTDIDDANDELEPLGIELPEHDDYDTVGGFVVTTMGKIPEAGEVLHHDGLVLTVLDAEPTRVLRVAVRRAGDDEMPAEDDAA